MGLTDEAHTPAQHKDPVQCTNLHKLVRFVSVTQNTYTYQTASPKSLLQASLKHVGKIHCSKKIKGTLKQHNVTPSQSHFGEITVHLGSNTD